VSQVRKRAKQIAKEQGKNTILVDGSPGVACNVISSITGAKKVIIVTEPTLSGLHDLERVYKVSQKFRLKALVVVNKYDLSMEMTAKIEEYCKQNSIEMAFKIPFDRRIVKAVVDKKIPSIAENKFFEKLEFQNFVEKL
jgi:MinD superfamily P-loop ATPase